VAATTEEAAPRRQGQAVETEIRPGKDRLGLASGPSKNQIRKACVRQGYQPLGPYQGERGLYRCPVFLKRTGKELEEHRRAKAYRRDHCIPVRQAS
jgi:hypothetical protein